MQGSRGIIYLFYFFGQMKISLRTAKSSKGIIYFDVLKIACFIPSTDCSTASSCSLTPIQHVKLPPVCDSCSNWRIHVSFMVRNDGIFFTPEHFDSFPAFFYVTNIHYDRKAN